MHTSGLISPWKCSLNKHIFLFDDLGIQFWQTVSITVALIWLYTFKSGIKTIVWTDTLQTLFMLIAVGVAIYFVSSEIKVNILSDK